jgi:hypothetical protein
MTDSEASQLIVQVTQLRLSPQYQAAELTRRRLGAQAMAAADETSPERAGVRLLIGTWDRIAIFVKELSEQQRRRFFECNPVSLMWRALEPAIQTFRTGGAVAPTFAEEFQNLASQYREWAESPAAQKFRTPEQQAVCALFG